MFNLLFYHFLGVSKTSTEAPCLPRHLPPSFILPGQLSDFEAALKRAAPAQPGTGQPGEVPWFQKCNNEDLARDIIYQSWVYWWFQNVSNTFDLKPPATGSGKALDTQHLSRVMFAQVLCDPGSIVPMKTLLIFYPIWATYFGMIQVTFGFVGWVGKSRGSGSSRAVQAGNLGFNE